MVLPFFLEAELLLACLDFCLGFEMMSVAFLLDGSEGMPEVEVRDLAAEDDAGDV